MMLILPSLPCLLFALLPIHSNSCGDDDDGEDDHDQAGSVLVATIGEWREYLFERDVYVRSVNEKTKAKEDIKI